MNRYEKTTGTMNRVTYGYGIEKITLEVKPLGSDSKDIAKQ